ncbi:MAG: hypothetical protein HOF30_01505, partial [Rhodospirillaceae bacterium]|nr:hypothetical protein [Rhodospirillaceae bacterium]
MELKTALLAAVEPALNTVGLVEMRPSAVAAELPPSVIVIARPLAAVITSAAPSATVAVKFAESPVIVAAKAVAVVAEPGDGGEHGDEHADGRGAGDQEHDQDLV